MTVEAVLQTVGGILLLISSGILSWALLQILSLRDRVTKLETRFEDLQLRQNEMLTAIEKTVVKMESSVTQIHKRLDNLFGARSGHE